MGVLNYKSDQPSTIINQHQSNKLLNQAKPQVIKKIKTMKILWNFEYRRKENKIDMTKLKDQASTEPNNRLINSLKQSAKI